MPEPQAAIVNMIAVTIITLLRPNLSARLPAMNAPTAQPRSIDATLNPDPIEDSLNAFCNAATVPLITPLSKPNRNPPMAAVADRKII